MTEKDPMITALEKRVRQFSYCKVDFQYAEMETVGIMMPGYNVEQCDVIYISDFLKFVDPKRCGLIANAIGKALCRHPWEIGYRVNLDGFWTKEFQEKAYPVFKERNTKYRYEAEGKHANLVPLLMQTMRELGNQHMELPPSPIISWTKRPMYANYGDFDKALQFIAVTSALDVDMGSDEANAKRDSVIKYCISHQIQHLYEPLFNGRHDEHNSMAYENSIVCAASCPLDYIRLLKAIKGGTAPVKKKFMRATL